ncbi:alcohol dehydrogenase catalytic domain-containing protein [Alloacidobacterium dinghuense]|uniref:Alcohol dehydrogenase catalytic domain-containing protein n=1 Tax=Alloacidobacterium dinghuense TaxID=2763107 RepID=A0A7G8BPE8_9BACT|nr:alcohol dehydrogenase catalytic domain-containing protein [Alloacidobacterium dinghuense]QNI34418.1 alcohol dehydrogenase catalytic domain-containing protein [Alloacidobacterium dinghuense]
MRALVYTAVRVVEMQERERPQPLPGESVIAIEAAGICGSDMSGFLGHSRRRVPPLVLGHELVGRLNDGRRVVANPLVSCRRCSACLSGALNLCSSWRLLGMDQIPGCFAEFVSVPMDQLYEIPEAMPTVRAVLVEPLANIVHLFRLASPQPFFRLGIVGAGTMGALALLTANRIGVREVLIQDVNDARLAAMRDMGATLAVNVATAEGRDEARRFAGAGFDLVLDASGSSPARQAAFDLCRPGGQVVLLGMAEERSEIDFVASIRKEHRVTMSFAYTPLDFERSLTLLKAGEIDLTSWTRVLPLEEGQQAFNTITQSPGGTLKMVLQVS